MVEALSVRPSPGRWTPGSRQGRRPSAISSGLLPEPMATPPCFLSGRYGVRASSIAGLTKGRQEPLGVASGSVSVASSSTHRSNCVRSSASQSAAFSRPVIGGGQGHGVTDSVRSRPFARRKRLGCGILDSAPLQSPTKPWMGEYGREEAGDKHADKRNH
jgi:hypothetical protein